MLLTPASIRKSSLAATLLIIGFIIITTAAISSGIQTGTDDDWASSVELADWLHTETVIIENLRNYVNALDTKISTIKKKTEEIRAIHDVAINDTGKYFGNPINTFTLIKRMTYDWAAMRNLAWQDVTGHIIENITVFSEFLTFPTESDMDEAVGKLLRIQDVYQMESSQVAMGEFNGMKFGSQMTWSDCFAIGQQSFRQGEHLVAKVWLQTALEKFPQSDGEAANDRAKVGILETLASTEYQSGNMKEALRLTEEILEISPKNKRAIAAQASFKEKLKRNQVKSRKPKPKKSTEEELLAKEVCRATSEQYIQSSFRRTCSYVSGMIPFYRMAPIKYEVISVDPFIAIYHNIFSVVEIENFKDFLRDKTGANVFEKLEKVTGHRKARFSDWTSIRNYYDDEIDFQQDSMGTETGKSIGVLWIQMNEPKMGGYVTFPQLETKLDVSKGSVLYWSTLNEFNEVDYRTKMFICPVIAGTLEAARTIVK